MKRSDAVKINLETYQRVELVMMKNRQEASIFMNVDLHCEDLTAYLKEKEITLFSYFIYACLKTVELHPELNRFVMGNHLYSHNDLSLSTLVKQDKGTDGNSVLVKWTFDSGMTIDQVQTQVQKSIFSIRDRQSGNSDNFFVWMKYFPTFLLRAVIAIGRILDNFNLLPASIIRDEPLHTGAVVANLGSIGLRAPFHHLYDWGTASVFIVMGKMDDHSNMQVTFTIDERIAEGVIFARALTTFQSLMENPYEN